MKEEDADVRGEAVEDGHEFFDLIADVDNISFDVSVSNESSPGTMRFSLTQAKVDRYAASVRNEIVYTSESPTKDHELEWEVEVEDEEERKEGGREEYTDQHWLLQDRAIIGSQFYWHCSTQELAEHQGDRIAEEALRLLLKNSQRQDGGKGVSEINIESNRTALSSEIFSSEHSDNPPLPPVSVVTAASLSTLTSVQAGVLLFLETWLHLVPEDFMLCVATCSSDSCSNSHGVGCSNTRNDSRSISGGSVSTSDVLDLVPDVLDNLLDFLRDMCRDPSLAHFGLKTVTEEQEQEHQVVEDEESGKRRRRVVLAPNSLLTEHFSCVSKLLVLVSENDSLASDDHFADVHSELKEDVTESAAETTTDSESCVMEDFANSSTSSSVSSSIPRPTPPQPPSSQIDRPMSLKRDKLSDNDRDYFKLQVERVISGEINNRENLTSLRMSFFDKFGEDSLSEILEFESEIMSGDCRSVSWKESRPQTNRFNNASAATTAKASSSASTVTVEEIEEHDSTATPSASASASLSSGDVFDGFSFFKSLFRSPTSSPEKVSHSPSQQFVASFSNNDLLGAEDDINTASFENSSPDVHIITLSSKLKTSAPAEKRAQLFVPQRLVPSALTAAAMGIRMSSLAPRGLSTDTPLNAPYGFKGGAQCRATRPKNKEIILPNRKSPLRSLLVSTLAEVNENSFATCIEMYSYFGMMLSAVELRTAQDYVASSTSSSDLAAPQQVEVPARLFVDPIDRYIIRYQSTDALCSEKISYLVKSSREESDLLPVHTREVTPPSADRERTPVARGQQSVEGPSRYMYDPDYNNSSSAADQQKKRNTHRKEQRRRTMGSFLSQHVSRYGGSSRHKVGGSRQTILAAEQATRRQSSSPPDKLGGRRSSFSASSIGGGGGHPSSYLTSSRSSSFSVSEALFGNSHVYHGPSLFLDYKVYQVAANLTMRLHYMYCTIPLLEFVVDYVYAYDEKSNSRNRTPMLTRFRKESEKLQTMFIGEVLVHPDVSSRAEVVIKMIKVAEHLARIRSHHALMLVVYALHTHAIYRLKSTWAVVHAKLPGRWDLLTELVGMGGNKLVGFFCQRQPRNGISSDVREDMFLDIAVETPLSVSDAYSVRKDTRRTGGSLGRTRTQRRENYYIDSGSSRSSYHFAKLRLGEVPLSPKRRVYSSDSNSSQGGVSESSTVDGDKECRSDCRFNECDGEGRAKSKSVFGEEAIDMDKGEVMDKAAADMTEQKDLSSAPATGCFVEASEVQHQEKDVKMMAKSSKKQQKQKRQRALPSSLPFNLPISMKKIGINSYNDDEGENKDDDEDEDKNEHEYGNEDEDEYESSSSSSLSESSTPPPRTFVESSIRVGFHFMKSGQLLLSQTAVPTAPASDVEKITAYGSTSTMGSFEDPTGRAVVGGDTTSSVSEEKKPISVHWQVENSTHDVKRSIDDDDDDDHQPVKMANENRESIDNSKGESTKIIAGDSSTIPSNIIKLPSLPSELGVDQGPEILSTQTVDMLVALAGVEGVGDKMEKKEEEGEEEECDTLSLSLSSRPSVTSSSASSRRRSYRYLQVHSLSLRPPQSGLGEVRSHGLTGSNAFSGIPVASPKPFMPFLNGILQKIIRLNELPNFLRSQTPSPPSSVSSTADQQRKHMQQQEGFLWVESPGNSSTDPRLMMINFGKFRSISNLLMLIRSSQLTPFSLHVDFAVQAMLYRNAMYKTEDDIWERSSELE